MRAAADAVASSLRTAEAAMACDEAFEDMDETSPLDSVARRLDLDLEDDEVEDPTYSAADEEEDEDDDAEDGGASDEEFADAAFADEGAGELGEWAAGDDGDAASSRGSFASNSDAQTEGELSQPGAKAPAGAGGAAALSALEAFDALLGDARFADHVAELALRAIAALGDSAFRTDLRDFVARDACLEVSRQLFSWARSFSAAGSLEDVVPAPPQCADGVTPARAAASAKAADQDNSPDSVASTFSGSPARDKRPREEPMPTLREADERLPKQARVEEGAAAPAQTG